MSGQSSERLLTLCPASDLDSRAIGAILDNPQHSRRHLFEGITESHPVDWAATRRTFGVRLGDELFGCVELNQDEDDNHQWELSVVLEDHKRSLDGARSAIAGIFYAFEELGARAVSFWAPLENQLIQTFAEQVGFTQLHDLKIPGGAAIRVFEMTREAWAHSADGRLGILLNEAVEIRTVDGVWRGEGVGFTRID